MLLQHLVFVYGTLKVSEPNHHLIQPGSAAGQSILVGTGQTENKFPLVIATKYNIPYLLDAVGTGNFITGEIYSVDQSMLERLDVLEGVPKHYQRRIESIMLQSTEPSIELKPNTLMNCWVYVCGNFKDELLQLPFLTSFSHKTTGYIPR